MNNAEFDLGRKKYKNLLKRKKKYLEKKQRYYDLLNEPLIKEYMEIALFLSEHNDKEFDEDLLSVKAFDKLAKKTNQSYGIYMYMGKNDETNSILLVDIETLKRITISKSNYETLKENNHVIYIENKNNEKDFYEKKLPEIREEYLISLKELDQESAKQKILKYNNSTQETRNLK